MFLFCGAEPQREGFVPDGAAAFSAPLSGGHELPQACSSLTGGRFFAEIQRGVALCGARETAAPAAGAKRKGHLRFPFLFELLPFPCFLIRRRFPICDRFEKGNGSRVTAAFVSQHIRSSQIDYCYTYGQLYAGTAYANIIYCTIYRVGCDDPGAPYVNSYADA